MAIIFWDFFIQLQRFAFGKNETGGKRSKFLNSKPNFTTIFLSENLKYIFKAQKESILKIQSQ